MSVNKVMLIGILGQDPELRYTQGGRPVCNMSIATNERWFADGEAKERTEWHRIVIWGKQAENCEQYLHKGSQVYVEGKLQTNKWEDDRGTKRSTTEINAVFVKFLDRESGGGKRGDRSQGRGISDAPNDHIVDGDSGDIPF